MDRRGLMALTLSTLIVVTVASLSALGESRLDVYLSLFTLEYLVALALFSPFNPRSQRALNAMGAVLFIVFCYFVAMRVMEVLGLWP